ncbi:MAG: hypothetical protein K0S58_1005 [Nitrospira sp.]|jgi:hypothetical protein|nr:hypothetical protein [Nitrospira sp.]
MANIEQVFKLRPDIINGDTSAAEASTESRQKRIKEFQSVPGFGAIILSPVAVGFGVNIQAANHVIHFTRTWNPAKEDQATDRAYRIGQTRDVYVYYPVGWWENVEACHSVEIAEGDFTRLREDLIGFLEGLERRVGEKASDGHASLRAIRSFLRTTEQRTKRSSEGILHTHFFDGRSSFPDFLRQVAGSGLDGMCLEIISPYFDEGPTSVPLDDLISQFKPREVRVFLPRAHTGEALCSQQIYEWVRRLPDVTWARLPHELLRGGKSEDVRQRTVHAKVYRFFTAQPKREILFVGSVNLTSPAHRPGGNLETGVLVELSPPRRPDWWLMADSSRPREYKPCLENEGNTVSGGTKLSVRFWWNTMAAEVYWDDSSLSPKLSVTAQGVEVFETDVKYRGLTVCSNTLWLPVS